MNFGRKRLGSLLLIRLGRKKMELEWESSESGSL
jgi:hypothetical protein